MIREDVLQCLSRKQKYYRLVLTSKEILLQLQGSKKSAFERYSIDDLFGCHTLRHKQTGSSFLAAYVCFYMYPRRKRVLLSKLKLREKVPLVFEIRKSGKSYEENLAVATSWKEDAIRLLRTKSCEQNRAPQNSQGGGDRELISALLAKNALVSRDGSGKSPKLSLTHDLSFSKRYLVIVNPVSGQGKGVSTFHVSGNP